MQNITITVNDHNKRIDKFLISYYKLPRSLVMKFFRKKDIRLNGKKISDNSILLKKGDELITYFKDVNTKIEIINVDYSNLKIVYEDKNILITDKESNLMVSGNKPNDLLSQVLSYLNDNKKIAFRTSFLPANIHRIDKNTTGLVIFALNYNAYRQLSQVISDGQSITKKYIAKVSGNLSNSFTLKDKISHNEPKQKMIINSSGKEAVTKILPLRVEGDFSYVEASILTGRKHQIRLQLANKGHPLVGDPKYGGIKEKTLHLCAYSITFNFLKDDLEYLNNKSFKAKLPKYLIKGV